MRYNFIVEGGTNGDFSTETGGAIDDFMPQGYGGLGLWRGLRGSFRPLQGPMMTSHDLGIGTEKLGKMNPF